jgi:hypothetical protein
MLRFQPPLRGNGRKTQFPASCLSIHAPTAEPRRSGRRSSSRLKGPES